jgi:hypothetical protein
VPPSSEETLAAQRAAELEEEIGHPQELWEQMIERVQDAGIRNFSEVAEEFLGLMWCLDRYRVADAPPKGMGKLDRPFGSRMDGIYRGKGNWFAILLGLLLDNRTGQKIRSISRIKGYSQVHQVDLAWPDRDVAPVVCAESKVTGGPAYRQYPARGAMNDWPNRRKELKFAATDLKLWRRDQSRKIGHWARWRANASPQAYMLWGARLREKDSIERMISETEALLATYLDGAGILAWQEKESKDGYRIVELPAGSRVEGLDDALWRIESEIEDRLAEGVLDVIADAGSPVDPDLLLDDDATSL